MSDTRRSLPAILAVLAFGLLSLAGGWMIVVGGGFVSAPARHPDAAVFVEGAPALLMAALQLLAAALAFTWLLRNWLTPVRAGALACTLVFVPPLLYLMLARAP